MHVSSLPIGIFLDGPKLLGSSTALFKFQVDELMPKAMQCSCTL